MAPVYTCTASVPVIQISCVNSIHNRNKYLDLKDSWGADGVPQTRTTC